MTLPYHEGVATNPLAPPVTSPEWNNQVDAINGNTTLTRSSTRGNEALYTMLNRTTANGGITDIATRFSGQNSRITSLEDITASTSSGNAALANRVSAVETRTTAASTGNQALGNRVSALETGVRVRARRATDLVLSTSGAQGGGNNIPFDEEVADTNGLWTPSSASATAGSQFTGFPAGEYQITFGLAASSTNGFINLFGLYILLNPNIAGNAYGAGQYGLGATEFPLGANVNPSDGLVMSSPATNGTAQVVAFATLVPADILMFRMFCTTRQSGGSGNTAYTLRSRPFYGGTWATINKIG